MRYSSIFVSALLLSAIYVITGSPPALAEDENAVVEAADEVSVASGSNRFVVWYDNTPGNYDIMFRRSTDNGATWKPTVNISNNPGESATPQITVSGAKVYVVWTQATADDTASNMYFRRSIDNGVSWGPKVKISASDKVDGTPEIAASGSTVYVFWRDNSPGNLDIFMRRSTDNGATWKTIVNISNNAGVSLSPQVAVSGSNVFVVWNDDTPGNYDIMFRRSTDNGATWKSAVNLSNDVGLATSPQVAVLGANVYAAWNSDCPRSPPLGCRDPNYDIFLRRSTDNGATWKPIANLSTNAGDSFEPQIAVSGSNVYVVWYDFTPGNYDIFSKRSTDNGATWKPSVNLSNSAGASFVPLIAVSGSNIYVVWHDYTPGDADIFSRRSTDNGATWKAIKNLSTNAGVSASPQVAVSGSNVYVVWYDFTPGELDIFSRRSTDNGATWKPSVNLSTNAGISRLPQIDM